MEIAIKTIIGIVSFIQLYIFIFECFLWETRGPKIFTNFPKELFPKTKELAFNQGVYNLFLALGLIWTFLIENPIWKSNISLFFLGCVVIAGISGALTEKKIFFVQSVPAIIGILLILLK